MEETEKQTRCRDQLSGAVLPEELIVWEILVRLRAKDLLRCRAVCRAWRHRTSAPDFLLAHHQRQPSLLLVSSRLGRTGVAGFDALNLRQRPAEWQPLLRIRDLRHSNFLSYMLRPRFRLHASRDGLILLSLPNGHFYLCNPATRQWISLPRLHDTMVAGMYSHSPTGEYRVLFWKWAYPSVTAVYYILTIGSAAASGEEPRCIGQPIASPSIQLLVAQAMILRSEFEGQPISLHDSLYWIREEKAIVVFDTVRESFRLMDLPTGARQLVDKPAFWHLIEMDGTLGISWGSEDETVLKLWVLQDYETETWSLRYQIDFSVVKKGYTTQNPVFVGTIVSDDGDALTYCRQWGRMHHLNSKGKLLQTLEQDLMSSWFTTFRFKESLFRHSFLEGPREGVPMEEPQLFVGL